MELVLGGHADSTWSATPLSEVRTATPPTMRSSPAKVAARAEEAGIAVRASAVAASATARAEIAGAFRSQHPGAGDAGCEKQGGGPAVTGVRGGAGGIVIPGRMRGA